MKIIQGNQGLFVAMPSKKLKDGRYQDIAHPLNQATRDTIKKIILSAYEDELRRPHSDRSPENSNDEITDSQIEPR